ncbi:hypothetical protein CDIK_2168, partial [Cucumispora dikerogammari]
KNAPPIMKENDKLENLDDLYTSDCIETDKTVVLYDCNLDIDKTLSDNFVDIHKPKYLHEFKLKVPNPKSPIGYFDLIFKDTFYKYLMNQINKRFDRISNDLKPKPITLQEIKIFIAINLYMRLVKINEIKRYWN